MGIAGISLGALLAVIVLPLFASRRLRGLGGAFGGRAAALADEGDELAMQLGMDATPSVSLREVLVQAEA